MSWYSDINNNKKLIIMRGLPGSGKSTKAKQLGRGGAVFSTDDYFMNNGKYEFNPSEIGQAHAWNRERVKEALENGISPVVVDNTNVKAWEAQAYVQFAKQYGYNVEIAESDTEWKNDLEELSKRNTHGVPKHVIHKMLQNWEPDLTPDDILNATRPL